MANTINRAVVAYVPVLHQGYLSFFKKYATDSMLFLVSREELAKLVPALQKDIRALPVDEMQKAIEALGLFTQVQTLTDHNSLNEFSEIVMPDDEAMRAFSDEFLMGRDVLVDSIFLRWDSQRSLSKKNVEPDVDVTTEELHQQFMNQAAALTDQSADWWRQIGAVITKNGEIALSVYNRHVPSEQQPYFDGDPRGNFHKGEHIEISTAIHAEAALIAEAARRGLTLEGTDLYVTTFPCPVCAKSVAYSGIKRVFFRDGYSMVDGEELMRSQGIEIIKVLE
jgi:dCMP deaminase